MSSQNGPVRDRAFIQLDDTCDPYGSRHPFIPRGGDDSLVYCEALSATSGSGWARKRPRRRSTAC